MSETPDFPVWINGQPATGLPVSDRGLAYGDGLFETIRITAAGPVLLDYHLDRLQLGLQRLAIPLSQDTVRRELLSFPGIRHTGVVKLIVTRGSGGRGYAPAGATEPRRILQHFPLPDYPDAWFDQGIRVFPCQTRLGCNPALAGIKHLNRLEQVLARAEWEGSAQFQEGLLCDVHGNLVEGVMSNVFMVEQGRVLTPQLDQCGVAGTLRRWLMEQLRGQGLDVIETRITVDAFRVAAERFFCNSVFGVWPVAHFEDQHWTPGPVSRLAQQLIRAHWF